MEKTEIVIIGGSAGSIQVVIQILQALPRSYAIPVIIVIHRGNAESELPVLFQTYSKLHVKDADDKEQVAAGTVYLAPGDYHLLMEKDGTLSLDYSEKINWSRPSIDATFETAADSYQNAVTAILLSGANMDGSKGLKEIVRKGGRVVIQDPEEAEVNYMPLSAIAVLPDAQIATIKEMIAILLSLN